MDNLREDINELILNNGKYIEDLLDNPFYPVFMQKPDGKIIYWNEGAERLLGYTQEQIIGKKAHILYPTTQISDFDADLEQLNKGKVLRGQRLRRHQNGSLIWLEVYSKMLKDQEGNPKLIIGTLFDVQPLKQLEEKLHENAAQTEAIIKSTVDGIITIDPEGQILSFNKAAERLFGYNEFEIIGKKLHRLVLPPHNSDETNYLSKYLKHNDSSGSNSGIETIGLHKQGTSFPVKMTISKVLYNKKRIYTTIIRDISERRKLEREIVEIGDEERMRIGLDLHDGLGQMLSGISLICQNLEKNLRADNSPYLQKMQEITELIKEADQYSRTLSHTLVPVELRDGKFEHAMNTLSNRFEKFFDVACSFHNNCEMDKIPTRISIHLYHVVQEAINNAVKHGKASQIDIYLNRDSENLYLCIQDNGIGFQSSFFRENKEGKGIRFMKHRIKISGGNLSIKRTEDGLTQIICIIPNAVIRRDL